MVVRFGVIAMMFLFSCPAPARATRAGGLPSPVRILAVAECEGPSGSYRTTVVSLRSGSMRLEQEWPDGRIFLAGVDTLGAWLWNEGAKRSDSAGTEVAVRLLTHEFHALDLWEQQRLGLPASVRRVTRNGRQVEEREFTHRALRLWADRDAQTGRVLSWRFEGPGVAPSQGVVARVLARERIENREVITRLVLEQGGNSWQFKFTKVELSVDPGDPPARP